MSGLFLNVYTYMIKFILAVFLLHYIRIPSLPPSPLSLPPPSPSLPPLSPTSGGDFVGAVADPLLRVPQDVLLENAYCVARLFSHHIVRHVQGHTEKDYHHNSKVDNSTLCLLIQPGTPAG